MKNNKGQIVTVIILGAMIVFLAVAGLIFKTFLKEHNDNWHHEQVRTTVYEYFNDKGLGVKDYKVIEVTGTDNFRTTVHVTDLNGVEYEVDVNKEYDYLIRKGIMSVTSEYDDPYGYIGQFGTYPNEEEMEIIKVE